MKVFDQLPPASSRMGFYRTVAAWKDAAMVEFGPEGTMHYAQGNIKGETGNLYTTGMKERQIIFGDTSGLENAIREIDAHAKPRLMLVVSSPVSEIIGADLKSVAFELQNEVRARLSVWDRVPVESTQAQGECAAYERAAKYLEELEPCAQKRGFAVLGLTEADWNGVADLGEIRRMAEAYFGLPCLNDAQGRLSLSDLASAQWILALTPASALLAQSAQKLWGTPWMAEVPYGVNACDRMVAAMEDALGKRAEVQWRKERAECMRIMHQLRDRISAERELRIFLDARPERCAAWERFLRDELGANVYRPAESSQALSTDGGVGFLPQLKGGDLLMACGLMCAMHPNQASLCIEYPAAQQKDCSRYIPMMGVRGAENFAWMLQNRLLQQRNRA